MSEYQRFVSYIYSYSSEGKGRNVGFAKVEVRGEQKRIGISLRGIYGAPVMQVYGFCREGEELVMVFLSALHMNGGSGQFQYKLTTVQIPESNYRFDQLAGLIIRASRESDIAYATVWDDEQFSLDRFRNEDAQTVLMAAELEQGVSFEDFGDAIDLNLIQNIMPEKTEFEAEIEDETEIQAESGPEMEVKQQSEHEPEASGEREEAETESDLKDMGETKAADPTESETEREIEQEIKQTSGETLKEAKKENGQRKTSQNLWKKMEEVYPKAEPIHNKNEDQTVFQCIKIKPGTIGRFPRQNWIFANNGFVLYGYMKYHYLVLVRMENMGEGAQYMLGVPGISYEKELPVAELFGFEQFYSAGRQGYWCVPLQWEMEE